MIPLTRAAGRLLGGLQFRASLGPMYLVPTGRGRGLALVAGELTTDQPLSRITATSRDAVAELDRAGLVELSDVIGGLSYQYQRPLDQPEHALFVELLRAGAATCPRCGAIGAEACSSKNGRRHAARPPIPEGIR